MNFLSGPDLVHRNKEAQKLAAPVISRGLKKCTVDASSPETQSEIASLQNDLFKMLDQERIERTVVRSQATYSVSSENDDEPTIQVTRKMGKWNQFGHVHGQHGLCLTEHEALYLIEMNRLELYYDTVIVSLEQAYALLLDRTISAPSYFVYAQLMRAGYVVELYDDDNDDKSSVDHLADETKRRALIWQCLYASLGQQPAVARRQNVSVPVAVDDDDPMYMEIKQSFVDIADCIRNQISSGNSSAAACNADSTGENWLHGARLKGKPINVPKKRKLCKPDQSKPLDILLPDIDAAFHDVFTELQCIQLTPTDEDIMGESDEEEIYFDFDLFDANANYRKSEPGQPAYRVIVIDTAKKKRTQLSSRKAISRCYFRQRNRLPVLVVFVNDTMAMQAFLYRL